MLFDNFLADKEDRFYFMFAFAVRAWLSLLFIVFVPFLLIHFGYAILFGQMRMCLTAYVLMLAIDFSGLLLKSYTEIKRATLLEVAQYGNRKYR